MEESSAPLAPTLNSTRVPAHSRRSTSRRRPDSQLSFKPPLSQERREERLRSLPSHPQPPIECSFPGSAGPHALPCSPRRGRGERPTQEVHPAPRARAPPPGTCPGPPAGDRRPHPHGLRCSRGPSPARSKPGPPPRQPRLQPAAERPAMSVPAGLPGAGTPLHPRPQ